MMSENDFAALVADIRTNGLREPIVMFKGRILDGRHRFRACQLLNITPAFELFDGDDHAARRLADSLNIHRRHLNGKARRDLVVNELKRDPAQSDRSIAKKAKVNHETVGAVRTKAEANGEIRHNTERTESTGRKARGTRPGTKLKAEREAEIRELAAAGNSVDQIAAAIDLGVERVRLLMRGGDIKVAIRHSGAVQPKTSHIATETVNVLIGTVQGVEMLRRGGLTISQEQAAGLLPELREAMKSLRWFEQKLKEIANG